MNRPIVTFDLVPNEQNTFAGSSGPVKKSFASSSLSPHPKPTLYPPSLKAIHTGFISRTMSGRVSIKKTR